MWWSKRKCRQESKGLGECRQESKGLEAENSKVCLKEAMEVRREDKKVSRSEKCAPLTALQPHRVDDNPDISNQAHSKITPLRWGPTRSNFAAFVALSFDLFGRIHNSPKAHRAFDVHSQVLQRHKVAVSFAWLQLRHKSPNKTNMTKRIPPAALFWLW